MGRTQAAKLWGQVPYADRDSAGFLLPVFRSDSDGIFSLQLPDAHSEIVAAFVSLDLAHNDEIEELDNKRSVRVGESLIYGFRNHEAMIKFGTLEELRTFLLEFSQNSDDTATKLQIAELIGNTNQRRDLRAQMVEFVERSSGEEASDNFSQTSLFLQALWDRLVRKIRDSDKLKLLEGKKKWLLLEADPALQGVFPLDVQDWLREALGVSAAEIEREVRAELPATFRGLTLHADLKPELVRERVFSELSDVMSASRQEARIARLIRKIMLNPGMGKHIAQQFQDKAEFARRAAKLVNIHIQYFALSPEPAFVNWFVDQLFSLAYPRQRGVLLYELANYLGEFNVFAEPILARARQSSAEAVRFAIEAIEEKIANPEAPPRHVTPPRGGYYLPFPRQAA